jgi:hypothetical protein
MSVQVPKMASPVRYEIKGPYITVAYGLDQLSGVFLSVLDNRLKYEEDASDEVNSIGLNVGPKDGGGGYFDLHTGPMGFGMKVSQETIAVYLKRYGVTSARVDKLLGKS